MSNESTNIIETMSAELEHLRPMEASLEMAEADVRAYKQRVADLEKEVARLQRYHDAEAIKWLAENQKLKNEIKEQKRLRNMALASVPNVLKVMKIIQNHKYRRCLGKAEWCDSKVYHIRRTPLCDMSEHEYWQYENDFWQRWQKRWMELAEKFKEAK